jgi:hypothetical protein
VRLSHADREPRTQNGNECLGASGCLRRTGSKRTGPERRELFLRLRDSWIVIANDRQYFQGTKDDKHARVKRLRAYLAGNVH